MIHLTSKYQISNETMCHQLITYKKFICDYDCSLIPDFLFTNLNAILSYYKQWLIVYTSLSITLNLFEHSKPKTVWESILIKHIKIDETSVASDCKWHYHCIGWCCLLSQGNIWEKIEVIVTLATVNLLSQINICEKVCWSPSFIHFDSSISFFVVMVIIFWEFNPRFTSYHTIKLQINSSNLNNLHICKIWV